MTRVADPSDDEAIFGFANLGCIEVGSDHRLNSAGMKRNRYEYADGMCLHIWPGKTPTLFAIGETIEDSGGSVG